MKKKNAFTLIELIAVLVILAVIALIVTPLVLNIVKKAKDSANKRSVDAYGKAVELAVATYLLDTGDYPTTIEDLTVEYSGNEVVCNVKTLNKDGSIYLSECTTKGTEVKDSKTDDGWYHYGKTTTISYDVYNVGDTVTYNGIDFYVIANSNETSDYVTLLKAEPLTVDEVNKYGIDENGVNYINKYTKSSVGTVYDYQGYGGIVYYSSSTCGYADGSFVTSDCTNSYDSSDVKYIVDTWATDKFNVNDLTEDGLGYKVRLILKEELIQNLGYLSNQEATSEMYIHSNDTPTFVYDINCSYWTMTPVEDGYHHVMWKVYSDGTLYTDSIIYTSFFDTVRPVINLKKSAIK